MTEQPIFDAEMLARARALGAATLHEAAGRIGALPSAIKPVAPDMRVAGPAYTVVVPMLDNLWIHRALYRAEPGDVLVVSTSGGIEGGYWGDILNEAAMARGLAGLVIDGGVRDTARLAEMGLPVFSNGICIRGTIKGFDVPPRLQQPIAIGQVVIAAGDLIVGDRDGVVAIPAAQAANAVARGHARELDEAAKIARIRAGERTLDIYGFDEK
ncbi:4-hydroxy-4-methyl-2-oxoglutarate aldolase [Sphingobium indicum IP26]|uniref:Putative 4-hydroxy-4-methyl-2-oxoglutarate aldolase n=1 Tax=Sphingobium indicum F2 TaxID=1450518 RepID=A0A8E0WRD5_9SPHN|nr:MULTISPECIES: 4-carboxy-4-hydroxy-2-oxoadipate aldolase/oxaloacetate decarboxylase [Sphingobium]EPR16310.1 4-hydroxy-4-methyl-2-oxoglutarate aldolase [Sphingobium indicum IP26]KER35997.1 4-hydroxy-4-methyl-2-oxoglutarate aldolase [Sphingobium indicum F2]